MKQTFQLIAIFALTLVLFVSYSKAPDYVADAIHLKQIGQDSNQQDDADDPAYNHDDENITEPTDTAQQRLLIFGDSMSQLLALRFSDYANQNGHKLTCVTWNGSSTRQWASTDTLRKYMLTVKPTHVFVCLGSNELYTADMKNCRKRAEQILAMIGNVPTTWVGPPNWMEDKGINDMLQKLVGKKHFFMTKGMKLERQKDGRHPTRAAAVVWVDKIVEWMNSGKAAHPFRLAKPVKRSANYKQVVIPMHPTRQHASADSMRNDTPVSLEADQMATQPADNAADRLPAANQTHDAATAPAPASQTHEKTHDNSHTTKPAEGGSTKSESTANE